MLKSADSCFLMTDVKNNPEQLTSDPQGVSPVLAVWPTAVSVHPPCWLAPSRGQHSRHIPHNEVCLQKALDMDYRTSHEVSVVPLAVIKKIQHRTAEILSGTTFNPPPPPPPPPPQMEYSYNLFQKLLMIYEVLNLPAWVHAFIRLILQFHTICSIDFGVALSSLVIDVSLYTLPIVQLVRHHITCTVHTSVFSTVLDSPSSSARREYAFAPEYCMGGITYHKHQNTAWEG